MVLGLFKSKKEREAEKNKKKLEITASTKVSGRVQNKKKSDAQRELRKLEPKEEKTPRKTGRGQGNRNVTGNQNRGGGNQSTTKSSTTKSTSTAKAAWLKKTRNSPAAKSGAFTADQRWAIYQKSQKNKKK